VDDIERKVDDEVWSKLWSGIRELSEQFDRIVFIGGVAVWLHVEHAQGASVPAEFSHPIDFYISREDLGTLRDIEEVTKNTRLHKRQVIKQGIDFDVYVEGESALLVGYQDVDRASELIDAIRVASIEHLLVLKLDAYQSRKGSQKGLKDERDLIRLGYLLARNGTKLFLLEPHLTPELFKLFKSVGRSSEFFTMCQRNSQKASKLRKAFKDAVLEVERALSS
jgi:hypothetical protein